MKNFNIRLERTIREWTDVLVTAKTKEEAEDYALEADHIADLDELDWEHEDTELDHPFVEEVSESDLPDLREIVAEQKAQQEKLRARLFGAELSGEK